MGLQVEWDIETEDRREQVAGGSGEPGGRRRRWWRWALAALLVIAAGAVLIRQQLRRIDERLRADLESTVAAETLALRIGDERLFRRVQGPDPEWQERQLREFAAYQRGHSALQALTGEVSAIEIDGSRAQVTLAAEQNGQPFCTTWLYEYDRRGWLHVGAEPYACSDAVHLEAPHFDVLAYEADRQVAEALSAELAAMWDAICAELACSQPAPHLEVQVTPSYDGSVRWADESTLQIPSPALSVNAARFSIERMLPGLVTRHWVDSLLAEYELSEYRHEWAENHLWVWVRGSLGGSAHGHSFFDVLAGAYGPDAVFELLERLETADSVGAALEAVMRQGRAGQESSAALEERLTEQLQLESMLHQQVDGLTPSVRALFRDPVHDGSGERDSSFVRYARPTTIEVVDASRTGDILWAKVRWRSRTTLPLIPVYRSDDYESIRHMTSYVPFRQVDGRWLRTVVEPRDYGRLRTQTRGLLTIQYRELDAGHVGPLLDHLEPLYAVLAADLGLAEPPPVEVWLTPATREYLQQRYRTVMSEAESGTPLEFVVLSTYLQECCTDYGDTALADQIRNSAARWLTLRTAGYVVDRDEAPFLLWTAFVWRELDQHAGLSPSSSEVLAEDLAFRVAQRASRGTRDAAAARQAFVDETWAALGQPANQHPAYQLGANILVEVLIEQYGEESIPRLFNSLAGAQSLDGWLLASLGVTADTVRPAWEARYEQALEEMW